MIPLHLPFRLARLIEAEAERAYPAECCGILFGREISDGDRQVIRIIDRIEPAANVFESAERHHRFSIDPRQLMHAERTAAEAGRLVLGFYHSHPDHPARPSEFDRAHAWPFYSYVIVSIQSRQVVDMTSWVLDDVSQTFHRQEIVEIEAQ